MTVCAPEVFAQCWCLHADVPLRGLSLLRVKSGQLHHFLSKLQSMWRVIASLSFLHSCSNLLQEDVSKVRAYINMVL